MYRARGIGGRWRAALVTAALGGGLLLAAVGCGSASEPATGGTGGGTVPTATATIAPPTAPPTTSPETAAPTGTPTKPVTRTPSRPATPATKPPAGYDPARDFTDLVPQTPGLTLDRPVNGVRHGELVVTIRNNGPFPVARLIFTVELPASMSADGGDWAGCDQLRSRQDGFPAGSKCDKGALGAGESRVYRLGVKSPSAEDNNDSTISRWLVDAWSAGPQGEMYRDTAPEDNRRIFRVTRS
ncbi:hypothetical protein [Micromonospora sp. NBC_01796]|uniref:hypothetical protein n=1 Tax=Micromonospora sp. NBC_01796 TaxID=2975987 RepID=UPI002DD7D5E7|nr:hypothetical protein [Micromonospora sp. NBC_01796]WSA87379.1 hypothetical protein OIE47_07145 [Micromonospora sp. NBC_01796]